MIVSTCIDESGGISVTVDSDGDQGDAYSTDVLADMVERAGKSAVELWQTTRVQAVE